MMQIEVDLATKVASNLINIIVGISSRLYGSYFCTEWLSIWMQIIYLLLHMFSKICKTLLQVFLYYIQTTKKIFYFGFFFTRGA